MLAYCRVLKVPWGILITAGNAVGRMLEVKDDYTRIVVIPVSLDATIAEIDASLEKLAGRVLDLLSSPVGTPIAGWS